MEYVYVLRNNQSGKLYKGSTSDLRKRILEHKSGKVRSTKNKGPWELVYYEAFKPKRDARREELFLKTGKGRQRLKYLLADRESGQDGNASVLKTDSRKG